MNKTITNLLHTEQFQTTRNQLSLVNASTQDVQTWLNKLSLLNVGDSARQLYTTLKELTELNLDDADRLELAELMRPALHTVSSLLSKHYFNQNLLLDERAERIADMNQQIIAYTATVYRIVAQRLPAQPVRGVLPFGLGKRRNYSQITALAIHRAIAELTRLLQELQLLYLPVYPGLWLRLHQLYAQAESMGMTQSSFADDSLSYRQTLSIEHMYLRAIFLSTVNPNKLRQVEIRRLFQLSELWVPMIQLSAQSTGHDLFLVDQSLDAPPMYSTKFSDMGRRLYHVNVQQLLAHFEQLTQPAAQYQHADEQAHLTEPLKYHLISMMRAPLERSFVRHAYQGQLQLALGLVGSHYQIANQRPFEKVIDLSNLSSLGETGWHLAEAADPGGVETFTNTPRSELTQEQQNIYQCDIVNISTGGYCVRWSGMTPGALRAGELVALREPSEKSWNIGLIRWVKQHPNQGAEFGIEVLSPRGKACGARVIRKTETSSFLRAILLPEVKSLERPATIITPMLSFKSGVKITIRLGREEVNAQLTREVMSTQSFSLFEFVLLRMEEPQKPAPVPAAKPTAPVSADENPYDDLWKSL